MDLYEKIKELAKQKKVSIRQVEEKLGIANGTIRRWGKTNPSVKTVKSVADYFNVSVDYLLGGDEAKPINEPIDLAEVANSDDDAVWSRMPSSGGRHLTENDKMAIKLLFSDKWDDITQNAKDVDNNK